MGNLLEFCAAIVSAAESDFQVAQPMNRLTGRRSLFEAGTKVPKKANDIVDNSFAEHLEKSGFLKGLWGGRLP